MRAMRTAPTGAVITMDSAATVKIILPHSSSSRAWCSRAISNAVAPMAALPESAKHLRRRRKNDDKNVLTNLHGGFWEPCEHKKEALFAN